MARNGNNPLYNPSGKAGEYAKFACNFYVGCSNDCEYCYCKRGVLSHAMGGTTPALKKCFKDEEDAFRRFKENVKRYMSDLKRYGIFFTFTSDPMLAETRDLHWSAAMYAVENGINVKFLTKRADFIEQLHIDECREEVRKRVAWGFTLTGHDEKEPHASTSAERFAAMKRLHEMGFKTFASIEPVIDPQSSYNCIAQMLEYCDLFKIGLLSGKREYGKDDIKRFFMDTMRLVDNHNAEHGANVKVYWKESVRDFIGLEYFDLPGCVGAEYDIFSNE